MTTVEMLGLAAGTITSITFIPQVIRIWRTKSVNDLSVIMLILLLIGTSAWLTYGIMQKDMAIIYTNSMVLTMGLVMCFFKIRYK